MEHEELRERIKLGREILRRDYGIDIPQTRFLFYSKHNWKAVHGLDDDTPWGNSLDDFRAHVCFEHDNVKNAVIGALSNAAFFECSSYSLTAKEARAQYNDYKLTNGFTNCQPVPQIGRQSSKSETEQKLDAMDEMVRLKSRDDKFVIECHILSELNGTENTKKLQGPEYLHLHEMGINVPMTEYLLEDTVKTLYDTTPDFCLSFQSTLPSQVHLLMVSDSISTHSDATYNVLTMNREELHTKITHKDALVMDALVNTTCTLDREQYHGLIRRMNSVTESGSRSYNKQQAAALDERLKAVPRGSFQHHMLSAQAKMYDSYIS